MKQWENSGIGLIQERQSEEDETDTSYVFFSNSKIKVAYKNSVNLK